MTVPVNTARLWKLWAASWVLAALCGPVVGTGGAALALRLASGPQALPFFLLGSLVPAFIAGTLIGQRASRFVPEEAGRAQRAAVVIGFAMISVSLSLAAGIHLIALALRVQGVGIAVASWPVGLLGCAAGIVATLAPLIALSGRSARAHDSEWTEPDDGAPLTATGPEAAHGGARDAGDRETQAADAIASAEAAAVTVPAAFDEEALAAAFEARTEARSGRLWRPTHTFGDPPFSLYADDGPRYPTDGDDEPRRAIETGIAESGVVEIDVGSMDFVVSREPAAVAGRAGVDASVDAELAALEPLFVGPSPWDPSAGWSFAGTRAPAVPPPAEHVVERAQAVTAGELSDDGLTEFPGRAPEHAGAETPVIADPNAVFEQVPLEQPERWPQDAGIRRGHEQFYAPPATGAASHGSLGPDWRDEHRPAVDERWDPMHPPVPLAASTPAAAAETPVPVPAPVVEEEFEPAPRAAAEPVVIRPVLAGSPFLNPLETGESVRPALRGSPMDQTSLDETAPEEAPDAVAAAGGATPAMITPLPETRSSRRRKRQRQRQGVDGAEGRQRVRRAS